MERKYQLSGIEVPVFYTIDERYSDCEDYGRVFAVSSDHFDPSWLCLGFVSRQTPFGQGIFVGIPRLKLRKAKKGEVLKALKMNHPHGSEFKPSCREVSDASFHLTMASAIANWTNDTSDERPIINTSRHEIIDYADKAAEKHKTLMSAWNKVCKKQIKAVKKHFCSNTKT